MGNPTIASKMPQDASMAALYVRNRRRINRHGEVPLSAGEIEYLSGKDEAARRRQRLLEVRNHEKRVAQLVTQRYRDNLRRLHAHKLRGAQLAHQQQQELLLGDLHVKYQQSLQNVGSAHRQAREMLAELVEDAHAEQSKWAFNEARVAKVRSGEASRLHDEEKEAEVARRKDVEDNLQRLKETSMRQRAQASIRARREQESQIELARRQEEAVRFRRQVVKEEVFTMSRSHAKDVDAYQFTRLHCVSAPAVPPTAFKPRSEVKVIRHNRAHPSAVNGIAQAKKYRDEMDTKREQDRQLREQNVEKAGQRGDDALEQVKFKQDGEKAIEWLQQIGKTQRYEQTVDYAHAFQRGHGAGDREEDGSSPPQVNERAAEETFKRMFAIAREDQLELSMHSAKTVEDASSVDRVAMSPLRQWSHQRRVSIDPAASEFDDDDERESFASSQSGSRAGSVGFEAITASFDRMRRAQKSGQGDKIEVNAGAAVRGEKVFDEASQRTRDPSLSEGIEDRLTKERLPHKVDGLEKRQPVDEKRDSRQVHGARGSSVLSGQFQSEQQVDTFEDRRASSRSSSSSESETKSEYQQQWHRDEARGGHAGAHSSQADVSSHERRRHQMDKTDEVGDEHTSFQYSITKDLTAKRTSVQPADRSEEGEVDEHSSLYSFASSYGRVAESDRQQEHDNSQEDRETARELHARTSRCFSEKNGDDEDEFRRHVGASSDNGGGNFLDARRADLASMKEDAGLHSLAFSYSSSEAYTPQGNLVDYYAATPGDATVDGDKRQLLQHDKEDSEHASSRSSLSSNSSGKRVEFQQQRNTRGEHASSLCASSSNNYQSDVSAGFQFQQHDEAYDEQTSLHSPAVSRRSSRRTGDQLLARLDSQASSRSSQEVYSAQGDRVDDYAAASVDARADVYNRQLNQHAEGESEHVSSRSSLSSSGKRTENQLQHQRNTRDGHASLRASSSSSHQSGTSAGYQFQQREEAYDEHTSVRAPAESRRSSRRIGDQLLERHDRQEDSVSLLSSSAVSSASRVDEHNLVELREREDADGERTSSHSSASSESRSSGSALHLRSQHENDGDYEGDFANQNSAESSARMPNFSLPRPGPLMGERANQHSPASSRSSQQPHVESQDKEQEPPAEPARHSSESFVHRQLLSESEESFDGSVSVESANGGATGDRGRLYMQKIHERLQNFAGRSSAASSLAQYSLPLSDSMSSVNESFHDHLAVSGYGDDSFIHKLVPMFPAPGTVAIRQASGGYDELHDQYDVQLVDPALSRMLADSMHSRISSMAPRVPHSVDTRDAHDETEAEARRFEQWSIGEQGKVAGVVMEQHSLLSDSLGSGVSSVGFSALLHLTAGTTRNVRDDLAEREALESEEKADNEYKDCFQASISSQSSVSVDARIDYFASTTAAVGESLSLHLRLPAMIYGNTDMSIPPRPIKWPSSPSSSYTSHESVDHREPIGVRVRLGQQEQKSVDSSDSEDRGPEREQQQGASSHQSGDGGDESDDEMQYEAFRRGLMEGKMGSLPPPPFGNMDMSRPPPPPAHLYQPSRSQSSSSSKSSSHLSAAARERGNGTRHEEILDEEDKRENDERASRNNSSVLSEASAASAASKCKIHKRGGESLLISVGSDENEEQKEDNGRAVSLADAFRQRHPRFRERVEENREQQKQKRQEIHNLQQQQQQQQQDKENSQPPNTATSDRNPGSEATKDDREADLTEEQQQLLNRLAVGERAQVSAQEMKERTRRNYQKLPEVVERKRQEEILRRRKQRLAELREQEKARRLEQKQRREQHKQRDDANN